MNRTKLLLCVCVLASAFSWTPAAAFIQSQQSGVQTTQRIATYIPTPRDVVTAMLRMANVGPADIVYDLGSGDGRIVIAAVKEFGAARGVGVEVDAARVAEAHENARRAGVADRVEFRQRDLFDTDLRPATVVTLYMDQAVNLQLRPKLLAELKPGSRVVSHAFDMGDWMPAETTVVDGRPVFLWAIPSH